MKTYLNQLGLALVLITGLVSTLPVELSAQTYSNLFGFTPGPFNINNTFSTNSQGEGARSGLVASGNTLYGTTISGGIYGSGVVFAMQIDGSGFTNLYNLSVPTLIYSGDETNRDGFSPGTLILSGSTLYEAASGGGVYGSGTIFAIQTNGMGFTNLYTFTEADYYNNYTNLDGAAPGTLILADGILYGAAGRGGTNGNGTVFKLNTNGTGFTVLHTFEATALYIYDLSTNFDGAGPVGPLVLSGSTLYGSAASGGTNGNGTLFQINTNGTGFKLVHVFNAGSEESADDIDVGETNADGAIPGPLILSGGTLYGSAELAGPYLDGTLFKVGTNGTGFTVLSTNVSRPTQAPLVLSGSTLFGMNGNGGTYLYGSVFAVNTNGMGYTNLYNFDRGASGAYPYGGLTYAGGILYGMTSQGGGSQAGNVFSLSLVPKLIITRSATNVLLVWPGFDSGYNLEYTTNLDSVVVWNTNATAPVVIGAQNVVTNPISSPRKFYRLIY